MTATIGIPWNFGGIPAEDVCAIFYSIIDLFSQEKIKNVYDNFIWDQGNFTILKVINQFPGNVLTSFLSCERPDEFWAKGSSWNDNQSGTMIIDNLNPELIAKNFTYDFLACTNFFHYEESLSQFDIKQYINIRR